MFFVAGQLHWFPPEIRSFSHFAPHKMLEVTAVGFSDAVVVRDCALRKHLFALYRRINEGREVTSVFSNTGLAVSQMLT